MSEETKVVSDPEKIYLEPLPAENVIGRQWCEDDVWGNGATAYVREDLFRYSVAGEKAAENEILRLRKYSSDLVADLEKKEAQLAEARAENERLRTAAREVVSWDWRRLHLRPGHKDWLEAPRSVEALEAALAGKESE